MNTNESANPANPPPIVATNHHTWRTPLACGHDLMARDSHRCPECGLLFMRCRQWGANFTKTEMNQRVMLPPKDKAGDSPKGLGGDGNKPLMQNRSGAIDEPSSPTGITGGNTF